MAGGTAQRRGDRLGLWRWPVIVVAGPLIGTRIMLVLMLVLSPARDPASLWLGLVEITPTALGFGYAAGLLPAIAAAILWAGMVPAHLAFPRTLVMALFIGALCGGVLVLPVATLFVDFTKVGALPFILSAGAGAVALAVTALPGRGR